MKLILLFACLLPLNVMAQGNLLVTPTRVVFDGRQKMQELNLANTGTDSARYLISFIEIRMNEDGTFDKINEPDSGQYFASDHVRFFPRDITLAPNEAQLVKLQLTKTNQMTRGEYRSHIYLRSVPNEKPLGEKNNKTDSAGIAVKLVPVFGITIPVIIHVGEIISGVNISDLSLVAGDDKQARINMVFNRSGNVSVYGDVLAEYISPQGKIIQVGAVNGIAVYTPNTKRQFHMDLNKIQGVNYHKGKLRVTYTNKKENATVQLTQAELLLQ